MNTFKISDVAKFLSNNEWQKNISSQRRLQQSIIKNKQVSVAIYLLANTELEVNIALDREELQAMIDVYADAEQAMKCLQQCVLTPAPKMQEIILSKGSHLQILALKEWQLSLTK